MHQYASHQHKSPKQQKGMTFIGVVIVGSAIFFVILILMKMFPAYTEYFSVRTAIHSMGKESLNTMTKREIMDSFNKRARTTYIDVIKGSDLSIEKNSAGDTVVTAKYTVVKPIIGNVSVLIEFETSSDDKI